MEDEIWKDIEGKQGFYLASNFGRIKSVDRLCNGNRNSFQLKKGKLLNPFLNRKGYPMIDLPVNGKRHSIAVHRVIALTFISNPFELPQVNHKDGNKLNNCVDNLEWCNNDYNMQHAIKNGLRPKVPETGWAAKLTKEQVIEIRNLKGAFTQKQLAKKFNTSVSNIGMIHTNKTWINI